MNLQDVRDEWLNQCGSCDAGLPMNCTCPAGDPRTVIAQLIREVERVQRKEHLVDVPYRHLKEIRQWLESPNGSISAGRVTFEAVENGNIQVRTRGWGC